MADVRRQFLSVFRWSGGHADFSIVLRDAELVASLGCALADPFRDKEVTGVIGIEARGFVVATLVARELGVGLILARKPGSIHPGAAARKATTPDWRGQHVELRVARDAITRSDRLVLADDWIETGSQARTVASLIESLGGALIGVTVVVDDTTEAVRDELQVVGLVRSEELPPYE